jgi:hypothetical protein
VPTYRVAPDGIYNPVFFLSVSVRELSPPKLGTGTDKAGKAMFVLEPNPIEVDIVAAATHKVLVVVIVAVVVARLKNTRTSTAALPVI